AEQRVLRVRGPAADDEPVDPERAEREDQNEADRDRRHDAADVVARALPAGAERDHREGGERGEGRQHRRADVEHVDRALGVERLLADQINQVGDRMQKPERPGAVGPVAELHPAQHLALDQRHVREGQQQQVDDQERLDDRDPPGVCHLATYTVPPSSPACSAAIRTAPARRAALTRAWSSSDVPLCETRTVSPLAIPRFSASSADSSTSATGRWNWSSVTRSTAGPEKSGL